MLDASLESLIVARLPNVRYLSGFTGSAGVLVVRPDAALFVSDGRYRTQSREQLEAAGVDATIAIGATASDQDQSIAKFLAQASRVGLEEHGVTWAQQRKYDDLLSAEIVAAGMLVEELRRVKDSGEIARVREACALGDAAFATVLPLLVDGSSEQEVALSLEMEMRRRGASGTSFDPIVASGPNAAKPHARPTDRSIGRGELVVIDFGCVVDGYCSDMTRTVSVGEPSREAAEIWELVRAAQDAGRALVSAGAACGDVDAACRAVISDAGHGEHFTHSTGHGVGIEIHEAPRVAATGGATLRAGDIVTVEPGVYLPGVGGVRIEDTFAVVDDGGEALTLTPKEMVIAGTA